MRVLLAICVMTLCTCGRKEAPVPASAPDAVVAVKTPDAVPALPEEYRKLAEDCEKGNGDACGDYGLAMLPDRVLPTNVQKAKELITRGCEELRSGTACGSLAYVLGEEKDDAARARYLEKACVLGELSSCVSFANALLKGRGVAPDPKRAQSLFEDACKRDDQSSCYGMVQLLENGTFRPVEKRDVRFYRKRSCDLGVEDMCEQK